MIRELIERLKTWVKETAAAYMIKPTLSAVAYARALIVAPEGNVLNTGKRYRLTSGHAPVSSH